MFLPVFSPSLPKLKNFWNAKKYAVEMLQIHFIYVPNIMCNLAIGLFPMHTFIASRRKNNPQKYDTKNYS